MHLQRQCCTPDDFRFRKDLILHACCAGPADGGVAGAAVPERPARAIWLVLCTTCSFGSGSARCPAALRTPAWRVLSCQSSERDSMRTACTAYARHAQRGTSAVARCAVGPGRQLHVSLLLKPSPSEFAFSCRDFQQARAVRGHVITVGGSSRLLRYSPVLYWHTVTCSDTPGTSVLQVMLNTSVLLSVTQGACRHDCKQLRAGDHGRKATRPNEPCTLFHDHK